MREKRTVEGSFRDRIPCVLFASLSVSVSLLLSGLTLYCKNSGEFTFRFSNILMVTLLGTLVVTVLFAAPQLFLWRLNHFRF